MLSLTVFFKDISEKYEKKKKRIQEWIGQEIDLNTAIGVRIADEHYGLIEGNVDVDEEKKITLLDDKFPLTMLMDNNNQALDEEGLAIAWENGLPTPQQLKESIIQYYEFKTNKAYLEGIDEGYKIASKEYERLRARQG